MGAGGRASQRDHTRGAGWEFLHIAIDDHSRCAFAQLLPDETARSAIAFLHAALAFFQAHGIAAQRLYSDNGSCYRAHAMRAAGGVAVLWNERTSTYVYYDGELGRTNYSSNNVSGGVRMSF